MSDADLAGLGILTIIFLIILGCIAYLIPSFIAFGRNHAYKYIILVMNIFGAWTGVLWIVSIVWACWPQEKSLADPILGNVTGTGNRNTGDTIGAVNYGKERGYDTEKPAPEKLLVECPFCKEQIMAAAIKCKHCGSTIQTV